MRKSKSKFPRPLITHGVALLLGFCLSFGVFQFSSSALDNPPADGGAAIAENETSIAPGTAPQVSRSFVAAAVRKTGESVVRIDTEKTVTRQIDPFLNDPFFREFFGDRFGQVPEQQQIITGQGSGFITDKNGLILTNAHVVSGADRVTVTLKDGRTFEGEVKGTDSLTDLAVVKINPNGQNLPVAQLGNSDAVEVGDWAIAVGNPVGLNNTVTLGIISTLDRSSAQVGIPDKRIDFLQTDAAINPGNSGGPLLNDQGAVIGINTAIRPDAMGIGFAIPINKAKSLQGDLAAGRQVPHPYIGIQMVGLTPELAQRNNNDPNAPLMLPEVEGVLVVRVMPGTPAEKGGIRRGDVILSINNTKITDAAQLQALVEDSGINATLNVQLRRGNQELSLKVTTAQMGNQSPRSSRG